MFHWICPECGREIAPAVIECPACDPASGAVESSSAIKTLQEADPSLISAALPPSLPEPVPQVVLEVVPAVVPEANPLEAVVAAASVTPPGLRSETDSNVVPTVVPEPDSPPEPVAEGVSAAPLGLESETELEAATILVPEAAAAPSEALVEAASVTPVGPSSETESEVVPTIVSEPDSQPEPVAEGVSAAPLGLESETELEAAMILVAEAALLSEPLVEAASVTPVGPSSEIESEVVPTIVSEVDSPAEPVVEAVSATTRGPESKTMPQAETDSGSKLVVQALSAIPSEPLFENVSGVLTTATEANFHAEPLVEAPSEAGATSTLTVEPEAEPVIAAETVLNVVPEEIQETVIQAAAPEPVLEAAQEPVPEPETFADRLAALAEQLRAGHIPYSRPEGTAPKVAVPPAAPLPAPSPEMVPEAPKVMALLSAPPPVLLLREAAAPAWATRVPSGEVLVPRIVNSKWIAQGVEDPAPCTGSIVRDTLRPAPVSSPGMADLSDYPAVAARKVQPVSPKQNVLAVDTAPRVTLPGPTLPRELTSLQAAGLGTIMAGRSNKKPSKGLPGWVVSFLVMAILLGTGFGVIFYTLPGMLASPRPIPKEEPVVAVAPPVVYPLAKNVEVTGFRFLTENTKKPEVHYLVVNHSNAVLSGMTVYVTLHAANAKPGQPPLSHFSFPAPRLAPFEFKEMTSPIEHAARPTDLPNWQDLRAEVEIAQ